MNHFEYIKSILDEYYCNHRTKPLQVVCGSVLFSEIKKDLGFENDNSNLIRHDNVDIRIDTSIDENSYIIGE